MTTPTNTDSSLSSTKKFGLDETGTKPILLYNHPHGLTTSSQQYLCKMLDSDSNLRWSKVPIPWGNSHVDIHQRDLFSASERSKFKDMPTMNLSLASINLGRWGQVKRLLGLQNDLYIVSPESSPNSSPTTSQHVTPNSTFKPEGNHD